jgi:hypothetical protein
MIALTTAVEGWGLHRWGKWQPKIQLIKDFSTSTVITFGIVQAAMSLAMVLIGTLLLLKLSRTFHSRGSYLQAFTTVAYGFCPLFLTRMLDAAPMFSPWVSWGIGITLSIWVLYQGLPRVMQPDPSHAFGLYLSMIFVVVLTSGVVRVFTALYLLGYVNFQNSWLAHEFPSLFQ